MHVLWPWFNSSPLLPDALDAYLYAQITPNKRASHKSESKAVGSLSAKEHNQHLRSSSKNFRGTHLRRISFKGLGQATWPESKVWVAESATRVPGFPGSELLKLQLLNIRNPLLLYFFHTVSPAERYVRTRLLWFRFADTREILVQHKWVDLARISCPSSQYSGKS